MCPASAQPVESWHRSYGRARDSAHRCRLPMFDPAGTYVSDFMAVDLLERETAVAALGEAIRLRRARRGPDGLGQRRAGDRQDRRWCGASPATSPAAGFCSGPATTSRSRVRSARSATSREACPPSWRTRSRADAAAHDIQDLLIAELERAPGPVVLVLEDVHWADDATLDSIIVLGRRIGTLPALVVVNATGAGRRRPATRSTPRSARCRRDALVLLELAPLSRARGRRARRRRRRRGLRGHRRQPVLRDRAAGLARRRGAAALGGQRGARARVAPRRAVRAQPRRAGVGGAEPGERRVLDGVMPGWPAAAEEPERRRLLEIDGAHVRFRHELARNAVLSSLPAHAAAPPPRRGAVRAARRARGPGRHRAPRAGRRRRRGAERVRARGRPARRRARVEPRGVLPLRVRRRIRRPARPRGAGRRAGGDGGGGVPRRAPRRGLQRDRGGDRASTASSATRPRWAAARACCRASTGSWATARRRAPRRSRRSRSSSRSATPSSWRAPAAAWLSWRCWRRTASRRSRWGERALGLATSLGDESTRAHALVNIACARVQMDPDDVRPLLDAHSLADAVGEREDATRALGNLGLRPDVVGAARAEALRYAEQALAYAESHEVHTYVSYVTTALRVDASEKGDWDEAERITHGEIERGITVVQLLAKTVLAELAVRRGDQDAGDRVADLAAHADRAAEPQRLMPAIELMARARADGRADAGGRIERSPSGSRASGGLGGRFAARLAGWAAVAGARPASSSSRPPRPVRTPRWPARLAGGRGPLRGDRLGVRPRADAVTAGRRAGAGRGARDRPSARRRPLTRRVDDAHARRSACTCRAARG